MNIYSYILKHKKHLTKATKTQITTSPKPTNTKKGAFTPFCIPFLYKIIFYESHNFSPAIILQQVLLHPHHKIQYAIHLLQIPDYVQYQYF